MTFNEIKISIGQFRLPYWSNDKFIKVNYNPRKCITYIHPSLPAKWNLKIKNNEYGEIILMNIPKGCDNWLLTE